MSTPHLGFLLAATLGMVFGEGRAAEIVLEQTAVQRLVEQSLFNDNGRYYVKRGACAAYFEDPAVSLKDGRITIRSHMSGRFGAEIGGNCVGVGLASWTTASGVPSAKGTTVRLGGIRVTRSRIRTLRCC
ncbi:hypothetical protein LNV47_01600 [Paucibacter sp. DJ4R-1]|nr:hypothetical protein [Paucibacter sp. DJ4R-1]